MTQADRHPRRDYPELYVLRHGQTEWNAAGRMQGHMDSPLTDLGREQAAMQGRILRALDLPADVTFHCSPQGRARQTAEIALAGLTEAPVFDHRLKEVSVGAFEGLTMTDLEAGWPEVMTRDEALSWHYRAPGGEGYDSFSARIRDWLDEQTAPAGWPLALILRVSPSCREDRGSSTTSRTAFTGGSRRECSLGITCFQVSLPKASRGSTICGLETTQQAG